MIIKEACREDIPRLTQLWQEAFSDPPAFIQGFFQAGFDPRRSAVAGSGAGALYWFDCRFSGKKIAYIYAVATKKEYRGRGICRELMAYAHKALQEQGYAGAILVPADEGLAGMYEKMGYRAIPDTPFAGRCGHRPLQELVEITGAEYGQLRRGFLPEGGVEHGQTAFSYMATFLKFYRFPGGICCGNMEGWAEILPGGQGEKAMYLPFDDSEELPAYFALGMG